MALERKMDGAMYFVAQLAASTTIREGMTINIATTGLMTEDATVTATGIATEAKVSGASDVVKCTYVSFGQPVVCPVLCGATLGISALVKPGTNGVAALTNGGATTSQMCVGRLVEAGALNGNLAGCDLSCGGPTVGS